MVILKEGDMKNRYQILSLLLSALALSSCSVANMLADGAETPDIEGENMQLYHGEDVTFAWSKGTEGQCQWYENDGFSLPGTAIEGETSPTLTIASDDETFSSFGIHYYECVQGTAHSPLYAVAFTGKPILYLDTGGHTIEHDTYLDLEDAGGSLVVYEYDEDDGYSSTDLTSPDGKASQIKGRGNTSWEMDKKGYNIKLGKKTKMMGMHKSKKWSMIANNADKTLLRNRYAVAIGNVDEDTALGESTGIFDNIFWDPEYVPFDFVLNGEYRGSYTMVQSVKVEEGRIWGTSEDEDADTTTLEDSTEGMFVVEYNARMDEPHNYSTTRGAPITLKDPDLDEENDDSALVQAYRNRVQEAEDALFSGDWDEFEEKWDTDSLVDMYLVNEFLKNKDSNGVGSMYYVYVPADGKMYGGPSWDFDLSAGNTKANEAAYAQGYRSRRNLWFGQMLSYSEFQEKVQDRWNEKKTELRASIETFIQTMGDDMASHYESTYNFVRWKALGAYWESSPDGYTHRKTYQSELNFMKDWLYDRWDWMDQAMNDLSSYSDYDFVLSGGNK